MTCPDDATAWGVSKVAIVSFNILCHAFHAPSSQQKKDACADQSTKDDTGEEPSEYSLCRENRSSKRHWCLLTWTGRVRRRDR